MTQEFSTYTLKNMKNRNNNSFGIIQKKFADLVQVYEKLEKTPRSYGTDDLLTRSEIHLIESIGDNDQSNNSVTDLAKAIGVTKGAVSQNLKKLEKKGISQKKTDPENISRSIVSLTSKGKAAYYSHKHWHETMDGGYLEYISNLKQNQIDFLLDFIAKSESFFQRVMSSSK